MILGDAVKKVKRYTHRGNRDTTTDDITEDIVDAINDARRDVLKELPKRWRWKEGSPDLAFVQGTSVYSLASDVQELILLRYVDSGTPFNFHKIDSDREWFQSVFSPSVAQTRPTAYREIGPDGSENKQIEIFPVPDKAYTGKYEYYRKITTNLTVADLSTEIPDIPDEVQDVLWKGAMYYFLKGFDDPAQGIAKIDFDKALMEVNKADEQDQDTDLSFRWSTGSSEPRGPQTGMRIF